MDRKQEEYKKIKTIIKDTKWKLEEGFSPRLTIATKNGSGRINLVDFSMAYYPAEKRRFQINLNGFGTDNLRNIDHKDAKIYTNEVLSFYKEINKIQKKLLKIDNKVFRY